MTTPPRRSVYPVIRAVVRAAAVVGLLVYVALVTADIVLYNYGGRLFSFTPQEKARYYGTGVLTAVRHPGYRTWLTGFVEEPGAPPLAVPVDVTARLCGQADPDARTVTLNAVDGLGFRNATPPSGARTLFLGDDFCQGAGSGTDRSIPALYAEATGKPVYAACNAGLGLFHYARLLDALTKDGLGPENRFPGPVAYLLINMGDDLTTDIAAFKQHQMDELTSHARHLWLASLRALWDDFRESDAVSADAPRCTRAVVKGDAPQGSTVLFGPLPRIPKAPAATGIAPETEDELRKVFAAMAAMARERGVTLRVVIIPTALQVLYPHLDQTSLDKASFFARQAPAVVKYLNQLTAFTVSAADEAGLPVLDLEPLFVARPDAAALYRPADIHLSPLGDATAAKAVREAFPAD